MLTCPMDVLAKFPVRKNKRQKQVFREAVQAYAEKLEYSCREETGAFGCKNLVIGDPEKASYLVTAHYDTCAGLPFPNLITPCNLWPFLGYQIFLALVMLGVALLMGLAVALITGNVGVGQIVGVLSVYFQLAWMLFGPANMQNANDNTSGVITLLEIARTLPKNQRHKVCFVLFDLEEAGLIGSKSYRRAHRKASDRQLVLNLDCIGDGDHLRMFPTKLLKKNERKLSSLYKACGYFGKKSLLVQEKGFSVYPSDQMHFPYGVGICALRPSKFGLYMGRIHTRKDTILEETNINILRAALTTLICCDAVQ